MLVSIVSPVFNEEECVSLFIKEFAKCAEEFKFEFELVLVNDGSTDNTLQIIENMRDKYSWIRVVNLSRNSGHMPALSAGYEFSRGDYVVTIDADLQDPPHLINQMVTLARDSKLDVVYGVRTDRTSDSKFKSLTAGLYYRLLKRISTTDLPHNAGDFRLVSRRVVDILVSLPERQRVFRLLVPWLGFPSGQIEYKREKRVAGKSHYPLRKLVGLGMDSVTSFSSAPLRIATYLGFFGVMLAAVLLVFVLVAKMQGVASSGWPSVMTAIVFFSSMQLFSIGLLGEYIARIFIETQHRPIFIAEEKFIED